jgi:hypothetical protein
MQNIYLYYNSLSGILITQFISTDIFYSILAIVAYLLNLNNSREFQSHEGESMMETRLTTAASVVTTVRNRGHSRTKRGRGRRGPSRDEGWASNDI